MPRGLNARNGGIPHPSRIGPLAVTRAGGYFDKSIPAALQTGAKNTHDFRCLKWINEYQSYGPAAEGEKSPIATLRCTRNGLRFPENAAVFQLIQQVV